MGNELTKPLQPNLTLEFEGRQIRFAGTACRPEWVAQDVGDVLGIDNISKALLEFDDDEKGITSGNTSAGNRSYLTVYESGLYRLIFQSRKPAAKRFQKWVFNEVLPALRKFGTYPPPTQEPKPFQATLVPYTARVLWGFKIRRLLPEGYWCVFLEASELLISAEHIFGPADLEMKQYDLLDGSVGKCWALFRHAKPKKPWVGEEVEFEYTFPPPDPRGTIRPWAYPNCELGHFKSWLHSDYWNIHFAKYVRRKYGSKNFQKMLPHFEKVGIPTLPYKKIAKPDVAG